MQIPTDRKSELALIGACLDGASSLEVLELVSAQHFYFEDCRRSISVIEELVSEDGQVNTVSFYEKWKGRFQSAPPEDILRSPDNTVPGTFALSAKALKETWKRRNIIEAANIMLSRAQDASQDVDAIIDEAESCFNEQQRLTEFSTENGHESAGRLEDDLNRRHQARGTFTGVATGLVDLDKKLNGLQFGEQTLVGARPGMGKTAIGLVVAGHAAFNLKYPVLILSLEMSREALLRRICSQQAKVPLNHLKNGTFTQDEVKKITVFNASLSKSPIHLTDAVDGINSAEVSRLIRRYVAKHGIKLVVVDYLQKIRAVKGNEKRTYEVAECSQALKAVAHHCKIAMLTMCQVNRESEKQSGRAPRLSDLADSGQIERDADVVLLLWRKEAADPEAALIIAKNRDGEIGCVKLRFDGEHCLFQNLSHS